MGDTKPGARIAELDGIRALACIAVMFFHAGVSVAYWGSVGVDVFFVLSGFLIACQLSRPGALPGLWLWRRTARLWPALLAMCLVVTPLIVVGDGSTEALWRAATYTYVPTFVSGDDMLVAHTWSLTVEMWCYLAAAVLFLLRPPTRTAIATALILAVVVTANRIHLTSGAPVLAFNSIEGRSDGLLIGIALGVAVTAEYRVRLGNAWLWIGGFVVTLLTAQHWASAGSATTSVACLAAAAVVLAVRDGRMAFLANQALVVVGLRTYSLYLCHLPVFAVLKFHTPLTGSSLLLVEFTTAFALAELSYRVVENPCRLWLYAHSPKVLGGSRPPDPNARNVAIRVT